MFSGIAAGGPVDGRQIESTRIRVGVPVFAGEVDLDPQSPRYGLPACSCFYYRFDNGRWWPEAR